MKLKTQQELSAIVADLKRQGKRVVFANGCFDVLHVGHIRYLREAKQQGDILIVALNNDASVRRLKGETRPILNEQERIILISALEDVDYVILFEDDTVDRLLLELKPHVHAKGSDYSIESVPERETVKKYGGSTSITGGQKVQSTRWLFEAIKRLHSH